MRDASDARAPEAGPAPARSELQVGRTERKDVASDPPHAPADVWQQRVAIELEYPVVFTQRLFDPANTSLAWAMSRREAHRRHRSLFVIDEGLARAWPDVERDIASYAAHHARRLEVVDAPRIVPG